MLYGGKGKTTQNKRKKTREREAGSGHAKHEDEGKREDRQDKTDRMEPTPTLWKKVQWRKEMPLDHGIQCVAVIGGKGSETTKTRKSKDELAMTGQDRQRKTRYIQSAYKHIYMCKQETRGEEEQRRQGQGRPRSLYSPIQTLSPLRKK